MVASNLGAKEILIGRPIISAMIRGGKEEVKNFVKSLIGDTKWRWGLIKFCMIMVLVLEVV